MCCRDRRRSDAGGIGCRRAKARGARSRKSRTRRICSTSTSRRRRLLKRIGEEYQNPLIVTGTVFHPHSQAGMVQREREVRPLGRRMSNPRASMERKGSSCRRSSSSSTAARGTDLFRAPARNGSTTRTTTRRRSSYRADGRDHPAFSEHAQHAAYEDPDHQIALVSARKPYGKTPSACDIIFVPKQARCPGTRSSAGRREGLPGASRRADGSRRGRQGSDLEQVLFLSKMAGKYAGAPFVSGAKVRYRDGESRPKCGSSRRTPQGFPQAGGTPRLLQAGLPTSSASDFRFQILDLVFRDQFFAWLIKKDKAAPQRPRQHYSGWVKRHDGNIATGGSIFVGARTPVPPGLNVGLGKDDTLFAKVDGRILRRPRPWSQNQFCPG